MERPRRKIINLAAERRRARERALRRFLAAHGGMYPLDAPGMPPAGPDFLRHARALGDTTVLTKATKKKPPVYSPGEVLIDLYRRALREVQFTLPVQTRPGRYEDAVFVPGHVWGENMDTWQQSRVDINTVAVPVTGPQPADVMVIGKMPWKAEVREGRNLVDASGVILLDTCRRLRIKGMERWYITNLCKFMPPDGSNRLHADWIHDCAPLLQQELRIVRPRYLLFLGADASKYLLGTKYGVNYMQGRVVPYTFQVNGSVLDPPEHHTVQCMTVLHPAVVARATGPHEARTLERGLARFGRLLGGADFAREEEGLDHRVCTSLEEARDWCQEVDLLLQDRPRAQRIIAIDAEWEGQHAVNANAWLATVQVSWDDKRAVCFHLRDEEGKTVFRDQNDRPALKRLARLLSKRLNRYRIAGHFFVSDLEMLAAEGYDFRPGFAVPVEDAPDGTPAWRLCMNGAGGLDTAMMAHAIEETGMLGLEHLTVRYTSAPVYHHALEDAVVALCKKLGIKRSALEGYGKIPRDILIPYAIYDADVTRRIAVELLHYLDRDYDGNNCWEPFWESMIIQPMLLEVHQTGIAVDRKRIDEQTVNFMTARGHTEEEIKRQACWPDPPEDDPKAWPAFNVRSTQHVKEYLFGEELNGRVVKEGQPRRIRPPEALSLRVEPLLDTSKPPKRWADIISQGREEYHSPSTGKQVLALLAQENPEVATQINTIRDYRFLDQVLKSVLRPPRTRDDDQDSWLYEPDPEDLSGQGLLVYDAGLAACIDDDGMVRTHIYPTAETGRWKHARPNLANLSKTRDPDYLRMLGPEQYRYKLRSIFMAPTRQHTVPVVRWQDGQRLVGQEQDDWVMVESDLKGAELYGMAIMSGSTKMIEHAQRAIDFPDYGFDIKGQKAPPEHRCQPGPDGKPRKSCELCGYPDPRFYDIHSTVAIMTFKLQCHPSKFGLGLIGKSHLRNVAKTAIFGLCYGRGAKAIALAAKEQGVQITVDEVQGVIDAIFKLYPELVPFFAECRRRAIKDRVLCTCFGRMRRFPPTEDDKLEGEFERQAMNYPIQGMIASFVDRWVAVLHLARERLLPSLGEYLFYWQLQIHDALLFRCKPRHVAYLAETLIPWSLQQVPIYPTRLDGTPVVGRGPYYLGADTEVSLHWGEKPSVAQCQEWGIPAHYGKG